MRTVILVGLDQLAGKIDFGDKGQLQAVYASEPEDALQAMGANPPALIVVNVSSDSSDPVDFVSMTRTCYPQVPVPIIAVDLDRPKEDAIINEYNAQEGSFYERAIAPRHLKQEIRRACGLEQPADAELDIDEIRKIGRNEFVKRGDKKYNIQTEIIAGEIMKIKTTIFEGGVIIDHGVQSCSRSDKELLGKLMKIAGSQHYEAVAKVRRGGYD